MTHCNASLGLTPKSIGRRIAQRRADLGITQRDLAARAVIGRDAIAQYEIGKCAPHVTTFPKLAAALDTTPGFLAWGLQ
jgi:transcriptional regulator with XRE-family HTH domain